MQQLHLIGLITNGFVYIFTVWHRPMSGFEHDVLLNAWLVGILSESRRESHLLLEWVKIEKK